MTEKKIETATTAEAAEAENKESDFDKEERAFWQKMTPRRIVAELGKFIVGQNDAKRAVALALRGRWRRMRVEDELRDEIVPKNILMIGPTGVGKTEISRRLARLAGAPFIKVEATKFTEVGYVGRDVDSIIRDLTEVAVDNMREDFGEEVREEAEAAAEERVLDALLPGGSASGETRDKMRKQLREGRLDDKEIEIETTVQTQVEIMAPPGMEEMTAQFQSMMQNMAKDRRKKRKMRVAAAFDQCVEEEVGKRVDMNEVKEAAIDRVEESGIVFIDEMDKIADNDQRGGDISRHGVQRDLLPLVEGTTVSTRYGNVHTDHILFIGSGAFHFNRPSDLIPELQGRFPLRVELAPLTIDDFVAILTKTRACLTKQYQALLATEGVTLQFTDDGVRAVAEKAWQINESAENIGARRLYTLMERLLEDISFEADAMDGATVVVDAAMVESRVSPLAGNHDRARYVL